ncbi:MAG TPA: hypothetical protein VGX02_03895 [Candidatus Eremiobacteraceae bacterium]|nr:hypothetical protein [Candidatus Eremiobacteraceae bacterium]
MHPLDTAAFPVRLIAGLCFAAFVWFVAGEIGYRLVRPYLATRASALALGGATGYALLGCAIALLGAAHALRPWSAIGIVVVAAIVRIPAYAGIVRRRHEIFASGRAWYASLPALSRGALFVCAFATLTALIAAALPAVWWDPIAYHLPIASRALATGAFGIDPLMMQSSFPSLGEACALPAYAVAGSAGAAMSTLFAGIILAFVCALLADHAAPGSGPLAAALVTSCELWLWLAPSSYVDVPFALFSVGCIAVPLLAVSPGFERPGLQKPGPQSVAIGVLCGALAGATAATKYAGLPFGIIAIVVLLAAGPRARGRTIAGFALGALAIAGGWYLRDLIATGDPLYPFLTAIHKANISVTQFPAMNSAWEQHWCGGGNGVGDLLTLPWRLLTDPRSFCGDVGYALRLGVIFAAVSLVRIRALWPIVVACAGVTLYWFALAQELRFLLPAVVLFAVLAAVGTTVLTERLNTLARGVLLALCAFGVLVSWLPWTIADASNSLVPGYPYVAGRTDGPGYLRGRLETYAAAEWLARHGMRRDQVISLDDIRTYYFWGGIGWANPAYQYVWKLDWSLVPAKRYQALKRAGYRYLLSNQTPAYVHRTPTGVEPNVLAGDVGQGALTLIFRDGDVSIYQIP